MWLIRHLDNYIADIYVFLQFWEPRAPPLTSNSRNSHEPGKARPHRETARMSPGRLAYQRPRGSCGTAPSTSRKRDDQMPPPVKRWQIRSS